MALLILELLPDKFFVVGVTCYGNIVLAEELVHVFPVGTILVTSLLVFLNVVDKKC